MDTKISYKNLASDLLSITIKLKYIISWVFRKNILYFSSFFPSDWCRFSPCSSIQQSQTVWYMLAVSNQSLSSPSQIHQILNNILSGSWPNWHHWFQYICHICFFTLIDIISKWTCHFYAWNISTTSLTAGWNSKSLAHYDLAKTFFLQPVLQHCLIRIH